MICPQCSAEVVAEAIFCHKCGQRIAEPNSRTGSDSSDSHSQPSTAQDKFSAAVSQIDTGDEPERDLWRGGYSSKAMIGAWCASAMLTAVLLVIDILWVRAAWLWIVLLLAIIGFWGYNLCLLTYRRLSVRYLLTNQRFIHELGILRRKIDRIEVIEMDDISFEQGVFERLVGVGTIRIISSDRSHPELVMPGIDNVREISGLFDDTRRTERRRRGLHIENI